MAANGRSSPVDALATHDATSQPNLQDSQSSTQIQQQTDQLPSTTPVEMSQLGSHYNETSSDAPDPLTSNGAHADSTETTTSPQEPLPVFNPQSTTLSPQSTRQRQVSEAIGPPTEERLTAATILQQTSNGADSGPAVLINLILLSGARHPFRVDLRYLRKRNVAKEGEDLDPFDISIYTMKELIWRDWREEWEPRPTIPGSIRLIHFGKLLDDKQTLRDCRFQPATPNVVHMTVRPQDIVDEEENAKSHKPGSSRRGRGGDDDGRGGCCGCVIL